MKLLAILISAMFLALTANTISAQITKEGDGADAKYTFRKKYPENEKLSYEVVFKKDEAELDKGIFSLEYKLMKLDEEFHVLDYSISLNSFDKPVEFAPMVDDRGLAEEEEDKYPDYAQSDFYYALIGDCRLPADAITVGTKWGDDKPGEDKAESIFRFNGIEKDGDVEVALVEMSFISRDTLTTVNGDIKLRTEDGTLQYARFNRHKQTVFYDGKGVVENILENNAEITRK